ncbi:MAG: V-type ATP synthase subunit I [Planctomycetota bacterium]|jgi:V/A-type H+-transporting ATPase subunit I
MFTTQMIQLFAVVLGRDSERVTEALLGEGVMQFVGMSQFEGEKPESISTVKPEVSLTEISDLRKRIEGFLHSGGIIPSTPEEAHLNNRAPVAIGEEKARLDRINSERESIRERQRVIQQEVLKLEDIKRQVDLYGTGLSDATLPARHSFISMQIGRLPASNVKQFEDALKAFPSLSVKLGQENDMSHHLMVTMKRDDSKINTILANVGWAKIELPGELRSVKKDVFNEISAKLENLTGEQKKLEKKANDLVRKEGEHLREVQTNFESSSRTVIFSGWLPANKKERLTQKIKEASQGRCYLEWNEPDSRHVIRDEVPVQFSNPKVLAPFQMLVSNFGVPRYGDIDPTPIVMPLYLSMFGLMFADLGQGLILAILGIIGAFLLKKQEARKGLYHLCWLLIWCGASSMVFGTLFGSFFGMTFKPLWFDFHGIVSGHSAHTSAINDVYDILSITIYFGITVIALGLLFNWINLIRSGKWAELLFDKGGVFGGWIYAGGIYIGYYMVSHRYKELPSGMTLFLLAGLPSLLLFIKGPYHYFAHRAAHGENKSNLFLAFMNMLMEWIVELLEIFAGYLSNTLSFMRVAGLGIAHVCLMISFFTLAEMTSGIGSVIILILGNLLVIGLEGLTAGIQALRLSYYEFFTKFFHGTGKLYNPISLKSEI